MVPSSGHKSKWPIHSRAFTHQKVGDVAAPDAFTDAHVEGGGEMQRLQILAPREREVMIAPAPRHREIELVTPGPFERPAVLLHRPLEHIDRMGGGWRLVLVHQ
jgi:hypothetical protein